jgi:hypothetical protein
MRLFLSSLPGLIYNILQQPVLTLDVSAVLQQLVALYHLRRSLLYSSLQDAASGRIDSVTVLYMHFWTCPYSIICNCSSVHICSVLPLSVCPLKQPVLPQEVSVQQEAAFAVFGLVMSGVHCIQQPVCPGRVCSTAASPLDGLVYIGWSRKCIF